MTHEQFHTLVAPTVITDVACIGTESKLTECDYLTPTTCGLLNDAGVVCQGKVHCTVVYYVYSTFATGACSHTLRLSVITT